MTPDEMTNGMIDEYRKLAIARRHALEDGSARQANKAFDRMVDIRRALRQAGLEHARKLLRLLDDENVSVRFEAAVDAIELSPGDAERVLADIAKEPGMLGFDAEMTLKYWKKGEFTVPWWGK